MPLRRTCTRACALSPALAVAALVAAAAAPAALAHAPHDVVEELAISPTFVQDQTLFATFLLTDHNLFGRSTDGGRSWQEYSLPMLQRKVVQFAFSPFFVHDGVAFAATTGLGVYRTTDHGTSWQPVNAGIPSLIVSGIAVSPGFVQDGLVVASTKGGCARSTDGGLTWTASSSGLVELDLTVVSFAPDLPGTLFIGGRTVHRSDDGGLTWSPRGVFPEPLATLACSPHFASDETVMLGFGEGGEGARISSDGGQSFVDCTNGLTDPFVYELAIADDGTVFAATKTAGCFRADKPGGAWSLVVNGFEMRSDLTDVHNTEAVVAPDFGTSGDAFVGSYEGLYITHDRGDSWRQSDVYNQKLNRHIVFSPEFAQDRSVFLGNYGGGVLELTVGPATPLQGGAGGSGGSGPGGTALGFAVSSPSGAGAAPAPHDPALGAVHWQGRSDNLTTLFSDALAISPAFATDRTLFYGYTSLQRSTDAAEHWTQLPKPASVTVVRRLAVSTNYSQDHTVFFGTGGQGTYRSIDSGETWSKMSHGLPLDARTTGIEFTPDHAVDRTAFLITALQGVFRTKDAGTSWLAVNAGLSSLKLRTLAVSPAFSHDRTAFVGSIDQGAFRSQDGGSSWAPVNAGLPSGGLRIIESIVLSPAFATDGIAFLATLDDGIFRSVDGGSSWQPSGNGMPLDAIRTLRISPDFVHDGTILAGTYGWTYQSRDGGASWTRLPGGLRVDETHPTVFRSANWTKVNSMANNGGSVTQAVAAGAWQEFEFFGDSITWYANRDSASGTVRVRIDGGMPMPVDLYSPTAETQVKVFTEDFHETGWHVIRVEHTGTKNPASTSTSARSDGFGYTF